jgi:hypothetical protein
LNWNNCRFITRKQPEVTTAWLLTGLALRKLDRPAEAIAPLKKVISKEPDIFGSIRPILLVLLVGACLLLFCILGDENADAVDFRRRAYADALPEWP